MKNKQNFSKLLLLLGLSIAVMMSFVTVVLLKPRTEAQRHGGRIYHEHRIVEPLIRDTPRTKRTGDSLCFMEKVSL